MIPIKLLVKHKTRVQVSLESLLNISQSKSTPAQCACVWLFITFVFIRKLSLGGIGQDLESNFAKMHLI